MEVRGKKLKGTYDIISTKHEDNRGFLVRTFDRNLLKESDLAIDWVQESHSHTKTKGTLRGFHVQTHPYAEGKFITALKGKMLWIVVDLRAGSDTFGQWDSVTLEGGAGRSLYVKRGFAHGCLSLTDNCDIIVKSDNVYSQAHGTGIIWNDADLCVEWGIEDNPVISVAHSRYGTFAEFKKTLGGIEKS